MAMAVSYARQSEKEVDIFSRVHQMSGVLPNVLGTARLNISYNYSVVDSN